MPRKKDGTTLINFVLDKSGSMDSIRAATISGFNEFKGDQARHPGRTLFSLTTFDTAFDVRFTAAPIAEVPDLSPRTYEPGGMTALYDAIAYTVRRVDEWVDGAKATFDKVLFVIMTDGEENSSREYGRRQVFDLIKEHQDARGFEFVYLGANQDAYAAGEAIHIDRGHSRAYSADSADTRHAMRVVSAGASAYRSAPQGRVDVWFTPEAEQSAVERDAVDATDPAGP